MIHAFKGGETVEEIAAKHGRTPRGIESRLEMLGMMTAEQRTTKNYFGAEGQHEGTKRTGVRRTRAKSKRAGN